jgi:hypothetical protein
MGLGKYLARKGAIGGTARFVANAFFFAFSNNLFDVRNCSTKAGLRVEIDRIVRVAINARFQSHPNHPDAEKIYKCFQENYKDGLDVGLVDFTIAILQVEAEYFKNTSENRRMFYEVIVEELQKKNVGEAMIFGKVVL